MQTIQLAGRTGDCRIVFGKPYTTFADLTDGARVVLVTDHNVHQLYGEWLDDFDVVVIESGEEFKTLHTVRRLYREFLDRELGRGGYVVAFGGGVVCDTVGFAAATYLRGLPFGFIPTTLLAQVDAAVGGKNGVNLQGYKNLVGSFNQPRFVLQDPALLLTLPRRELGNGLAETIKQAAIGDAELFAFLEQHIEALAQLDMDLLSQAIEAAVRVKAKVVEADETETGPRRVLNFGHTFGHALEKISTIPHGEAVAMGMVVAGGLSVARGLLDAEEIARLTRLLLRADLPISLSLDKHDAFDAIRKDKKREDETIHVVLLRAIGQAVIESVTLDEIETILDEIE